MNKDNNIGKWVALIVVLMFTFYAWTSVAPRYFDVPAAVVEMRWWDFLLAIAGRFTVALLFWRDLFNRRTHPGTSNAR